MPWHPPCSPRSSGPRPAAARRRLRLRRGRGGPADRRRRLGAVTDPAGRPSRRRPAAGAPARLGRVLRPAHRRPPGGLRAARPDRAARRRRDGAGRPAPAVLDLCCGSGAAAVVLHERLAPRWLAAADIDPVAVACARRNLEPLGVPVYQGDLFDALPAGRRGTLDLVVANAPYVPTAAVASLPAEARLYEAPVALDGGTDGLAVLRRVASGAAEWLAPGGHVVVEVSVAQAPELCAVFTAARLEPAVVRDEEREATAVTARRPG
ncbi:methyltransferase domain-containing protein [Micromonospora sp. BRA006-A]|nr:methyltransferase domain-containing protein [Micromonospora sp. BRA006-A]